MPPALNRARWLSKATECPCRHKKIPSTISWHLCPLFGIDQHSSVILLFLDVWLKSMCDFVLMALKKRHSHQSVSAIFLRRSNELTRRLHNGSMEQTVLGTESKSQAFHYRKYISKYRPFLSDLALTCFQESIRRLPATFSMNFNADKAPFTSLSGHCANYIHWSWCVGIGRFCPSPSSLYKCHKFQVTNTRPLLPTWSTHAVCPMKRTHSIGLFWFVVARLLT